LGFGYIGESNHGIQIRDDHAVARTRNDHSLEQRFWATAAES